MVEDERSRQEDLAATAASIRADARRIDRLESEKQQLSPGDPRGDTLSREVERIADGVQKKARIERALHLSDPEPDGPASEDRRSH